MAERQPDKEFGRRKPVASPTAVPVKRSGHVGLLMMGTMAVGGGAYALMPNENCQPNPPGMPALPQGSTTCAARGSSGGSGGYSRSSRFSFFSADSSSSRASATSSDSSSPGVTRGGFGSFARAFGFSGRG